MVDFAAARRMMVDGQVRTADVTDPRIIAALIEIERERFLPDSKAKLAYLDLDVPVEDGEEGSRRLLKPMVFAKLVQLAEVSDADRVLDVGCTSGYSTAVLARLAGFVVGLEEDPALAQRAQTALAGANNVTIVNQALVTGAPAQGPYDAIILQGATEIVPQALFGQLKDGGRLVCVLGRGPGAKGVLYRHTEGQVSGRPAFEAAAPLLPGFAEVPTFVF